jgi:hypothetical protein
MMRWGIPVFLVALVLASGASAQVAHDGLVAKHAAANGVPESLVRRVIRIESRGNPRAVSKGNYGLMQIRLGTARAMGYAGTAQGLLDPDTNMTFAVKYLAGAYRAAGCNTNRAIAYYQRGYHRAARSRCSSPQPSPIELVGLSTGAAASAQPVGQVEQEPVSARAVTKSAPEPVTTQSTDVLKPRVVQTVAISRSKYEPFPVRRVARSEPKTAVPPLPRARPNPGPAPSTSGSKQGPDAMEVLAAREPEAVPLPRVKQPLLQPATRQKAQPVHSSPRKPARVKTKAGAPFDLLSFIKTLVTPESKKPPARKRRSHAQL